ncbi:MAG: VWA domain-containing protein [Clostridium baratii]|uniref:VWA domain-containing protein n=1 Tax=Clostridium baratii TaxID=1561 RepID=UPI00242C917C|nr:vWA domain-containing protein [Clostridium baratii]MBS6007224.1 VWA domain-containing protein [Clostridium baratii]
MRKQKERKFNFKKMAIALAFILCNCFLINAMAEPYSQAKVTASGKSTENEIKREKTVKSVGNDEYEISLKVWGNERTTVTPVDIVMVMDTSGSMKKDLGTLKKAMNTFIDDINNGVKESRISVVEFAGPTSFNNEGETDNAQVIAEFDSSIQQKKTQINATKANGGTNAESAWDRVKEQIDQSKKDRPNANRYVLFFTDGLPTVINGKRPVEETKHDYIRNTIIPATMKKYEAAVGKDVKSYAIGLLDNVGTNGRDLAKEFLNKVNNQKAYFIENKNINLGEIYKDIANNIIKDATIAKDAVLTDVVTDEFEIITGENGSDITSEVYKLNSDGTISEKLDIKGTINEETGTISWKLGEVGAGGMLVKFRIKLKDEYYGTGTATIPTNKEANMIYTDPVTNKNDEKIEFNKPEISIPFKTGSITIEKVVENNKGLTAPIDDTFSISLDSKDIGELNVNLKNKESKTMSFYLKGKNTDISTNTDMSKNYINVGTYNIEEIVPMNYELEGIYIYNSNTGLYEKTNKFTIDKKNKDIKIKVKNKYVNDKYFYDKEEKENILELKK